MFESLYIHFPFCESKCHYCDFYSLGKNKTKSENIMLFEKALNKECQIYHEKLAHPLKTIFFGGGTPSLTPPENMHKILAPLKLSEKTTPSTEWTIEANPSSINLEKLKGYKALGVNRISMGIQSLNQKHLKLLGRVHDRKQALNALTSIFKAGFKNVSVDLLCGVPTQTLQDLEHHLTELLTFPITHLSCYLLTLFKSNVLYPQLPNEETQLKHFLFVDQWLSAHGFEHYEISNYAKPGYRAKHNLNYWKGGSYLGLGPSAHSYCKDQEKRSKNTSLLNTYIKTLLENKKLPIEWEEILTPEQKELERWMLTLRLSDGFPTSWIKNQKQKEWLKKYQKEHIIEDAHVPCSKHFRLTPDTTMVVSYDFESVS
ncbi:MAG: radical SAM family heme chaperone HemW [Deltaproteobacteria bacterium]|nr:radical SAM family heme chaperone HemW [Deltaproteobacteria bacterium]